MKNIVIKGNGSMMIGKKIIEILKKLGSNNSGNLWGNSGGYYGIKDNVIFCYTDPIHFSKDCIIYNSLQEYLNSFNKTINYNDI